MKVGKCSWAVFVGLVYIGSLQACSASGNGGKDPEQAPDGKALQERPNNPSCVAFERPVFANSVAIEQVYPNLNFSAPIAMLKAPGNHARWYVVEKAGRVLYFEDSNEVELSDTFVDLSASINSNPGEAGLLGMAFHPDFENNRYVFLSFTFGNSPLRSRIARYETNAEGTRIVPGTEQVIMTLDQPYDNHNGGHIAFGPDGYLYIGFGDGGDGGDPHGHGQKTSTLLGAMLRLDVDGSSPYSIPADNPFAGSSCGEMGGGCPEIYAWGLRNPWRWSFDILTGELWVGDVGQDAYEEVNRVVMAGNYGWNTREGAHCYNAQSCEAAGLIDPVAEYSHSEGQSITGGFVYRGSSIPALSDAYIYGDFVSGRVWKVSPDGEGGFDSDYLLDSNLSISSFAQDQVGEMYILDYATGQIYQLVPGSESSTLTVPEFLSQTGCVNPDDPTTMAQGVLPYDINAPFWSDGATKSRYLAIPDGTTIAVNADGDWELPNGSVLIKHFRLNDQLIETRLLIRHEDGQWAGYTYEWDETQSDAIWLSAGKIRNIQGQDWIYPSSAQCLQCHTSAAGRSLGLEDMQLNKDMLYPSSNLVGNQILTLAAIGMFSDRDSMDLSTIITLPDPFDDEAPLDARARSYLHTNCSQCHRPDGPTNATMDLRFSTELDEQQICNADPMGTIIDISGLKLLAPGDAASSLLWLRMQRRDQLGMPPLGSAVPDPEGITLLESWINSLADCP